MSTILSNAVAGLTNAGSRIFTNAKVIVNASSTSENSTNQTSPATKNSADNSTAPDTEITKALVAISADSTVYAANAKIVKAARQLDKALLDTIA